MALKPRIKAVCPVCGRELECDVQPHLNAGTDTQYTIVVSPLGRQHITDHL